MNEIQVCKVVDEEENIQDDELSTDISLENINDYGTKINALINDIKLSLAEDSFRTGNATKSVVFSQFTQFLSLCEVFNIFKY